MWCIPYKGKDISIGKEICSLCMVSTYYLPWKNPLAIISWLKMKPIPMLRVNLHRKSFISIHFFFMENTTGFFYYVPSCIYVKKPIFNNFNSTSPCNPNQFFWKPLLFIFILAIDDDNKDGAYVSSCASFLLLIFCQGHMRPPPPPPTHPTPPLPYNPPPPPL